MALLMSRLVSTRIMRLQSSIVTLLVIALLGVGLTNAFAQRFQKGDCLAVINVDPWDFLFIRARPDHRSGKIAAIRYDTANPVVVDGNCTPNTTNLRRLWCPVKYYISPGRVASGYVKMHFTRPKECPPSYDYYLQD